MKPQHLQGPMFILKLAFVFIILLSTLSDSFINKVAVFKRWNKQLKRHNYIITCGDIHEGIAQLNTDQIKAIDSLVYNSDPNQTLFLVEDIASITTTHPLLTDVVQTINTIYSNPNMKVRIPLVTLVNSALKYNKNAKNIDERAHTLIQTLFYYLVRSYIETTTNIYMPRNTTYKISLPEVSLILSDFLKNFENDYFDICKQLAALEKDSKDLKAQSENNQQKHSSQEDLKHYISFYNSFLADIETDKKYAQHLITNNSDLITHFVKEYKNFKNIKTLNLESPVDGYNFNLYMGSGFLTRMLTFGSYTVELKALKFMIENLDSKTKIFIFTGQKHTEILNQFLEKMSFERIYHKTQTEDISKIYANISDHVLKAKSFNKVNNKYILKMKQNLKSIDHNFFKICQKKHFHAQDFKNFR